MNKFLLFLVMLPKALWRSLGADIEQLKWILSVKLKMDDRKPLGFSRPQAQKKPSKYTSALTVVVTFFTGIVYIFPLFGFKDTMLALFAFYSMMLVLLSFMLIMDFSSVLVDTRDKLIIFTKPVNDKTIFLSRMLHILIYFMRIVLPMSLPAWIVWGILKGWKGVIWFPIPLILLVFICLFVVLGCYLLLLRLAKPEKFKDIIGYFQIAFSIIIFASYYLLPRATDNEMLQQMTATQYPWIRYVPSYWLAACWTWVEPSAAKLAGTQWLSIAAVLFPLAAMWVTIKMLAPSFIKRISAIDGVEVHVPNMKKVKKGGNKVYYWLANVLNTTNASKAGFMLTWLQTARSRTFKMRVYPSFAYIFVYFFYILLSDNRPFAEVWESLPQSGTYLLLLYLSSFAIMNAINFVTISEQYKAAWVYYSSPVATPGHILGGAFKAMWVKYYLPFFTAIAVFVIYIWGFSVVLDILLAMVNVTMFALCILRVGYRHLPFSLAEQIKTSGAKTIFRVIFVFALIGGLGIAHHLIHFWWLKLLFLVLSSIFLWLVWDSYHNTNWKSIRMAEDAL